MIWMFTTAEEGIMFFVVIFRPLYFTEIYTAVSKDNSMQLM